MKANHFAKRSLKQFLYAASGIMVLLLVCSFRTVHYIPPYNITANVSKDEPQPRMFLIAVADTDDDSIGERCKADLEQITDAFKDVADWIDADITEKIISGAGYSKAAVNDAINNWLISQQPSRRDIVIFYYTGHGFRYPADASNYPRMWLKTASDRNIDHNNLSIEGDVFNRIVKMGAGMNIVLSDCCNNTVAGDDGNFDNIMVSANQRKARKREHPRDENDNDDDYGDKLFITDHPVSILVTAAGKGELAGGKPDIGGFFTTYFLDALYMSVFDNSLPPSWKEIFGYADDTAGYWAKSAPCPTTEHNEQGRCVQDAVIQISGAE